MRTERGLPRPVQVLCEGTWYPGWLEDVRHDADGWHGFVRYTTGPDQRRLAWFGEAEIRPS